MNSDFFVNEDNRYILFGSRKLYKSFLRILDERKSKGLINDEQYLEVLKRVDIRFSRMHAEAKGVSIFNQTVINDYRKVFQHDPVVRPYLEMAKSHI